MRPARPGWLMIRTIFLAAFWRRVEISVKAQELFAPAATNRNNGVTEKFFVRVDETEEFPFLVTKLSPYYGR